jgi:Transposase DDE domain group 1
VVLSTVVYPRVHVATSKTGAVGQAGGLLLTKTIRATGLDQGLGEGLSRWRKPMVVHDPGKVVLDLAISLVLGGDALADVGVLRAEPGLVWSGGL